MKKIFCLIILVLMAFSLCSCGTQLNNIVVRYSDFTAAVDNPIESTIETYKDSIVNITSTSLNPLVDTPVSSGCAVVYKKIAKSSNAFRYYALTNYSIIGKNTLFSAVRLNVYLKENDTALSATLLGVDAKTDLAIIYFDSVVELPLVVFPDDDYSLKSGSFVTAISSPSGKDYTGSASFGIVSHPNRHISIDTDGDKINDFFSIYIQHDASISDGSNGGGLFSMDGLFLGITTINIETADIDENIENINFAIPYNIIRALIPYMETNKPIIRPRLGVEAISLRDLTPEIIAYYGYHDKPDIFDDHPEYGIYVTNIPLTGSVATSMIKKGDVILTFDGIKITQIYVVSTLLSSMVDYHIGDSVELTYYSQTEKKVLTTTVILKGDS